MNYEFILPSRILSQARCSLYFCFSSLLCRSCLRSLSLFFL